jgi:hypothetical protein
MNIEVIRGSISPSEFFERFINKRKPVKLVDFESGAKFWTNKELRERAGESEVKCEIRASRGSRFGLGNEISIKFSDFLDRVAAGDESLYLTTQDLEYTLEGK